MRRKLLAVWLMILVMLTQSILPAFADSGLTNTTGWVETTDGWIYLDENGDKVCNEWKKRRIITVIWAMTVTWLLQS